MATPENTTENTDDKKHQANTPGTSSQSLADSEMSAGKGALDAEPGDEQENKEADRNAVQPSSAPAPEEKPKADWGGQFGNSVQPVHHDADRLENQLASPGRGEFGAHGPGGTQGGYGNQYRADDVYGGQLGSQPVSTGGYQGGRPENNTGTDEYNPQGSTFGHEPATPTAGTTVDPHYRNDNASPTAPDSGFSADYGHSSLVGGATNGHEAGNGRERNQSADYGYIPSQNDKRDEQPGTTYSPQPTVHGRTGELNGANEPGPNREPATATGSDSRTGYTRTEGETSYQGNSAEGIGSKGGSYNDPNDSSNPAAGAGGDVQQQYSRGAQNDAPVPPHDNDSDYGTMPRRNAGRDNDADRS